MDRQRLHERCADYEKALNQLAKALKQPRDEYLRDSVIQRFEITYELAWKMLKLCLEAEGISVRGIEELVTLGLDEAAKPSRATRRKPTAPGLSELAERLGDRLDTRVRVELGRTKGKVSIEFATLDDLRRIVDLIDPRNRQDRPF